MPEPTLNCPAFSRGDDGYDAALGACSFNARPFERYPDLIVQAQTEGDVVAAVTLARDNGWKIGVRSGGHSWAGNHIRQGGLLLDVSRLNTIEIDAEAMRARVGPGARGDQVNDGLARRRLFFPVGHCKGVGVGGYLLQGGFGWNGRALGMACENVVAIDYVGADGVLRHASETENSDMLWAARGAGPGFFAVVTRYHLKLHPRPKVIGTKVATYPLDRLEELFRWAHAVGPDVPQSIELMLMISRNPIFGDAPGIDVIAPVFADSIFRAWRDLAFMKSAPKGAVRTTPFVPMKLSRMTQSVMAHYPSGHRYAVDNMWTGAGIEDLLPGLKRIAETLPAAPSHMLWMNWQPPARTTPMAYSLEDRTYIACYGVWNDPADEAATATWAQDNMTAMAPFATGIQLADENLGRRPAPFMAPANLDRLDAIRAAQDPEGRFHPWMGRPA